MDVKPLHDYILVTEEKPDTGAVTGFDQSESWQCWKIVKVGEGRTSEYGTRFEITVKVGDIIYTQKHAEADTPKELLDKGYALIQNSRIMAVKEQ